MHIHGKKGTFFRICALIALFVLVVVLPVSAENPSPVRPPLNPVKLIFIHHSCGQNWLADENGGLGIALRDNNYFVSDTNYDWGPDIIGSNTDIGDWWTWFRSPRSPVYLADLYNESGQTFPFSRLPTDPGGQNRIVMFKSCFPNSNLRGDPTDPVPPIEENLLKANTSDSEFHTVANAKGIYIDLLEYFRTRPDILFVVIAAPPVSAPENSANARVFNQWLVNDWLAGYNQTNVAVWDFFNVLTTNGGDINTNDLNQTTGNHHRWWNGGIQHPVNLSFNTSAYPLSESDDHPTRAGNLKATEEYTPLLNYAYNQWAGNNTSPVAIFTANITSGPASLTVQFYDNSTGTPTSWNWSFGDGNFSTAQHPAHTYAFSGTFAVSLNATNAAGSNVLARTNYIAVTGPKPIPDFTANVTSGPAPLPVSFADRSLNDPAGRAWYFGDEQYATKPWTELNASAGWETRYYHTSVVLPDGTIVLMGGVNSSGSLTNDVWQSANGGRTWTQVNASAGWTVRSLPTSVVLPDETIVLMGGSGILSDVWQSADCGRTWTEVNASAGWSGRSGHASVVLPNGMIVLMGGYSQNYLSFLNDIWQSADGGRTWTLVNASAGWSARDVHSSVAMPDGTIVLMGGQESNYDFKNDVWRSTDNGTTWTEVNPSARWSARWGHSSLVLPDGSIVLTGGYDGFARKNDIWRSTDNGATWTEVNASAEWSARLFHTSVVLPDGTIVLIGGDYGYPKNEVWSFATASSSLQNPAHVYASPGLYDVTLQAYNDMGYNSSHRSGYITVFPKGDFNTNWRVDIGDVTRVAYMAVNLTPWHPAADFNRDTRVDIGDASKIAWYYVGKIPEL
jgi:PKD repeat protein